MYLVAIMDWYSRRVLSWRVSNTLDTDFCIEALEEALQRFEAPEIFNTDQGSQFTCAAFTDVLKGHAIAISMDGKGRWVDNVFVERLWRSVKYEDVYLRAYETPTELRTGLARYFGFYNTKRRHSALDRRTPDAVYFDQARRDLDGFRQRSAPLDFPDRHCYRIARTLRAKTAVAAREAQSVRARSRRSSSTVVLPPRTAQMGPKCRSHTGAMAGRAATAEAKRSTFGTYAGRQCSC